MVGKQGLQQPVCVSRSHYVHDTLANFCYTHMSYFPLLYFLSLSYVCSYSRTSYSIFISGGFKYWIHAFCVHYPEEGNNNTLTLILTWMNCTSVCGAVRVTVDECMVLIATEVFRLVEFTYHACTHRLASQRAMYRGFQVGCPIPSSNITHAHTEWPTNEPCSHK